jgi:hypothetical protein
MTLIRKLALALFSAFLFTSYSNSQDISTTGNLINYGSTPTDTTSKWNNGVYVNTLCFQYGQPGNCGPNPSVRPNGVINYSYGTVDLNQVVSINKALAIGGSGVQLSGFNFGFMAKNGNGWDDGRQDYLSAYVKLYGSTGNQVANYDYTSQTNRRYNWTQFNFSETFTTPYTVATLGNAQVGFVGRDNNFWSGNYGPEIYNVSFSLKYSVKPDPCIADPLSSPTCSGYAIANIKNSILSPTTSYIPTTTYTTPTATQSLPESINVAIQPSQQVSTPTQQGPVAQTQDVNQNPSVAQMDPAQPSPTQAGPAPTSPQPAGGPPQVAQQSATASSSGPTSSGSPAKSNDGPKMTTSQALSIIKSVQEKDKATQQMAVQNAAKVVEGSTQQSQATVTSTIASLNEMSSASAAAAAQFSSQTTQSSIQVATQLNQTQQTTQSTQQTTQSFQNIQATQSSTQSIQYSSGTGITVNNNSFGFNSTNNGLSLNNNQQPQTVAMYQPRVTIRQTEVEVPMQVASFSGTSRPGNPLSEMMTQQNFEMMQSNIEQRGPSVNRNVQPNDLASGVDIASMVTQPRGFELYSFTIRDTTFYPPKEVYKDQKVIDNVMVLRQLSSDRLHQELVNLQYK